MSEMDTFNPYDEKKVLNHFYPPSHLLNSYNNPEEYFYPEGKILQSFLVAQYTTFIFLFPTKQGVHILFYANKLTPLFIFIDLKYATKQTAYAIYDSGEGKNLHLTKLSAIFYAKS